MLNCVTLQGRLVADPELKTTTSGKEVTSFRIAVDRSFAKSGEERQADFFNIVCWEKTAEFVCKYFSKGSMIIIQGQLQARQYDDKDGNKRTAVEVVAREVNFGGSKNESTPTMPAYQAPAPTDFEEIQTEDDLPF